MSFCIGLSNFIQIYQCMAESWRHVGFQNNGHDVTNLLPALGLVVSIYAHTKFRWDISICGWNITILLFSENKRLPYWNSPSGLKSDHINCFGMRYFIISASFVGVSPLRRPSSFSCNALSLDHSRSRICVVRRSRENLVSIGWPVLKIYRFSLSLFMLIWKCKCNHITRETRSVKNWDLAVHTATATAEILKGLTRVLLVR